MTAPRRTDKWIATTRETEDREDRALCPIEHVVMSGDRLIANCGGGPGAETHARLIVKRHNTWPMLYAELVDLIPLARAAMREANNDGAEYDVDAELADARAAIAAATKDSQ